LEENSIIDGLKQRIASLENQLNNFSLSEKILKELEQASEKEFQHKLE
jgi:hypothetical protein